MIYKTDKGLPLIILGFVAYIVAVRIFFTEPCALEPIALTLTNLQEQVSICREEIADLKAQIADLKDTINDMKDTPCNSQLP